LIKSRYDVATYGPALLYRYCYLGAAGRDACIKMLLDRGVDPNYQPLGETERRGPLGNTLMVSFGHSALATIDAPKMLICSPLIDLEATNSDGHTALDWLIITQHFVQQPRMLMEVMRLLIEHGADVHPLVEATLYVSKLHPSDPPYSTSPRHTTSPAMMRSYRAGGHGHGHGSAPAATSMTSAAALAAAATIASTNGVESKHGGGGSVASRGRGGSFAASFNSSEHQSVYALSALPTLNGNNGSMVTSTVAASSSAGTTQQANNNNNGNMSAASSPLTTSASGPRLTTNTIRVDGPPILSIATSGLNQSPLGNGSNAALPPIVTPSPSVLGLQQMNMIMNSPIPSTNNNNGNNVVDISAVYVPSRSTSPRGIASASSAVLMTTLTRSGSHAGTAPLSSNSVAPLLPTSSTGESTIIASSSSSTHVNPDRLSPTTLMPRSIQAHDGNSNSNGHTKVSHLPISHQHSNIDGHMHDPDVLMCWTDGSTVGDAEWYALDARQKRHEAEGLRLLKLRTLRKAKETRRGRLTTIFNDKRLRLLMGLLDSHFTLITRYWL
jgi:hypothetical protein